MANVNFEAWRKNTVKCISVFNRKGGVGKTTITINLAAELSFYHNKRVLVVDCDPQGNATSYLDISGVNSDKPDLSSYYLKETPFEDIVQSYHYEKKRRGTKSDTCSIDLIPGGLSMDNVDITNGYSLLNLVSGQDYDYVLFDCPPSMSSITLASLFASDYVLVPAEPDSDSLGGFQALVDMVNSIKAQGHQIEVLGIVLNKVSFIQSLDKYLIQQLTEGLPEGLVFKSMLRRSSSAKNCRYFGQPVCIADEGNGLNKDLKEFTQEFLEKAE